MASSKQKPSAAPAEPKARPQVGDRPPAEQVSRELYKTQFGTTKPDAELPKADADIDPDAPLGGIESDTTKED